MDAKSQNELINKLDGSVALMPESMDGVETGNVEAEVVLREYNLRQLEAQDMGAMCRIITAIGIRQFRNIFSSDTIKTVIGTVKGGEKTGKKETGKKETYDMASEIIGISAGIDAVGIIMENYPKAENEIMTFLASVSGMETSEIKKLSFADYGQMLIEIVTKEDFRDFFRRVRVLLHI